MRTHTVQRGFGSSTDEPVSWWAIYNLRTKEVTVQLVCICGQYRLLPERDGTALHSHNCCGDDWTVRLILDGYEKLTDTPKERKKRLAREN